jgi:hypothetical protein
MVAKTLSLFLPDNQGTERGVAQKEADELSDAAGGAVYELMRILSTWYLDEPFPETQQ